MRKPMMMLLAGSALAAIAGTAQAQLPFGGYPGASYGGGATATLYEYPNFQGRSVMVNRENGNLDGVGFNDRARSARFEGTWRICEDANYRSRCETLTGAVPDLRRTGIQGASSLQMTSGGYGGYPGSYPGSYPGGYPGSYPDSGYGMGQGVAGTSVVFYPGPVGAMQYGGSSRRAADDFCRQMGNSSSVYYGTSGGLSDVLCRR